MNIYKFSTSFFIATLLILVTSCAENHNVAEVEQQKEKVMTDQTRWGIDMVQQENKAKAYKEQKEMRDDLAFYVLNCGVYQLQKMTERMKQLKNENSNS